MKLGIGITTTPKTQSIISDLKVSDQTTVIVHNDLNRIGVSRSRNNLIKHLMEAECEYLAIVDDDVTFLKEGWFEMATDLMKANDLDFAGIPNVFRAEIQYGNDISFTMSFLGCFHIFNRKFIEEIGYFCNDFDTYGYEDSHLQYRIREHYGIHLLPYLTFLPYCIISQDVYDISHESELTRSEKANFVSNNRIILDKHVKLGQIYYPYEQHYD